MLFTLAASFESFLVVSHSLIMWRAPTTGDTFSGSTWRGTVQYNAHYIPFNMYDVHVHAYEHSIHRMHCVQIVICSYMCRDVVIVAYICGYQGSGGRNIGEQI